MATVVKGTVVSATGKSVPVMPVDASVSAPVVATVVAQQPGADVEMTLTSGEYPSSIEMSAKFQTEFGLSGSIPEVVDAAAALYSVHVAGKSLVQKAEATWDVTFGKPGGGGGANCNPVVNASQQSAPLLPAIDGSPRLQLVRPGSFGELRFDHAATLREGATAPLTAGGLHVGPFWQATRNAGGQWDYIDLGVSERVAPINARLDGPYVVWDDMHGEMVFDISMWQLVAGRHLVVVKATPGNPGGPTRMSKDAAGRDFVLYDDGTHRPAEHSARSMVTFRC